MRGVGCSMLVCCLGVPFFKVGLREANSKTTCSFGGVPCLSQTLSWKTGFQLAVFCIEGVPLDAR